MQAENLFAAKPGKKSQAKSKAAAEKNAFAMYPADFSAIMEEALNRAKNGDFENAIEVFDERIFNYKKPEGSQKNSTRIELISADIKILLKDYRALQIEKAAKKIDFKSGSKKESGENSQSFFIENYFSRLSSIDNKIKDLGQQIQSAGSSGYPYYLSRFILGVNEEPSSGIAGILDLQYRTEVNMMMDSVWSKCSESSSVIEKALSEANIFTNSKSMENAEVELENIRKHADELKEIFSLNSKLKQKNSKSSGGTADFNSSMNGITSLCADAKKLFSAIKNLQEELKNSHAAPADRIAGIRSENDSYAESMISSATNFSSWGKTAAASAKSNSLNILSTIKDEKLSWKEFTEPYKNASLKMEALCTQKAIAMWVAVANYYAETGSLLYREDAEFTEKIKSYMNGIDGVFYPSRSMEDLSKLRLNINKDKSALEDCKVKLNSGYLYRANFRKQLDVISENSKKISALEVEFSSIEENAKGKLLKAQVAKNEISLYCKKAKDFNGSRNFSQTLNNFQNANNAYARLSEELKNDGDIMKETFDSIAKLRNEIIEVQQPVFNGALRNTKNQAKNSYYAGDFEKASGFIATADMKRDMWAKLLDIDLESDAELERIRNYVNTAIAIKEGREIHAYDAKAPEMRQNLSLAAKYFESGERKLAGGNRTEAEVFFSRAREKINQVKIYYPRNKTAGILALKITKVLDPGNFDELYKTKIAELKQIDYSSKNAVAQESYSSLLDLYEMNRGYPGLKTLVENAEYALGLKQRPVDKSKITKANAIAKEAQELLNKAGRDEILLGQAKGKAQQAMELDPDNNAAITVLDEIALRTGQQSAVTLSAADESLYQGALSDIQKNKIFDANSKLAKLMQNSKNLRSAKILKLKKRIEAQL